jgi:hypothetical protein
MKIICRVLLRAAHFPDRNVSDSGRLVAPGRIKCEPYNKFSNDIRPSNETLYIMPDISKLILSCTVRVTTLDCQSNAKSHDPVAIDNDRSLMPPEAENIIQVPGAMHGCQIMTEPESMDERDIAGMGSNKRPVYLMQYESIDQETQAGDLSKNITTSSEPNALGGFSDIYRGTWTHRVSIDNQTSEARTTVGVILRGSVDRINKLFAGRCQAAAGFHETQRRPRARQEGERPVLKTQTKI